MYCIKKSLKYNSLYKKSRTHNSCIYISLIIQNYIFNTKSVDHSHFSKVRNNLEKQTNNKSRLGSSLFHISKPCNLLSLLTTMQMTTMLYRRNNIFCFHFVEGISKSNESSQGISSLKHVKEKLSSKSRNAFLSGHLPAQS